MLTAKHPRLTTLTIAGLIGVFTFVLYTSSPGRQTDLDTRWSIHVAESIVREGNIDIDEYRALTLPNDYRTFTHNGHLYNFYPIGVSVLAVPFVYLYHAIEPTKNVEQFYGSAEIAIASLVMALTAAIVYLTARLSLNIKQSLLSVFIFVFCTSAWSIASRALWQHGPSMLMLGLALYLLLLARRRPSLVQFAGLPLAFSYIIRPTNGLSAVLLTLYVLIEYRRFFLRYVFWAMWIIAPFLLLNLSVYQSLLPGYFTWYQQFSTDTVIEGLVGTLLSPARGLLIFSPIFVFSVAGIALKLRHRTWTKLDTVLFSILFLHWITISIWPFWWGGWSFGPRYLSDMIPYFMFFLMAAIPFIMVAQRRLIPAQVVFVVLAGVSAFIHYRGATDISTFDWNSQPVDIVTTPWRLWDWQDFMFLRGIPEIDAIIPTKIATEPETLYFLYDPAGTVQFEIYDLHYRKFDWTADTPAGVHLASKNTDHARKYTASVRLNTTDYATGWHQLSVTIKAHRRNGSPSNTETISVPMTIYIGPLNKVFLPIIVNASR